MDSNLSQNSTGISGGGIALWKGNTVHVDGTLFQENTVTAAGGDQGGGGIYLRASGYLTLTNSTFVSNTSNWDGGGLYAYDPDADGDLNLTWVDNRFQGNKSIWGAAALIRSLNRFDARRTQILANVGLATGGTLRTFHLLAAGSDRIGGLDQHLDCQQSSSRRPLVMRPGLEIDNRHYGDVSCTLRW